MVRLLKQFNLEGGPVSSKAHGANYHKRWPGGRGGRSIRNEEEPVTLPRIKSLHL